MFYTVINYYRYLKMVWLLSPLHLALTTQDQGILNVPYWIELYCLVKTKLKNLLSYSWQIEVRDRTEPRYGIQQFHWGQEWHWKSSLTLSHTTHPNSLLWSDHLDITDSQCRLLGVQDFVRIKKNAQLYFEEENIHGCTVHLTGHLLSETFIMGKTCHV